VPNRNTVHAEIIAYPQEDEQKEIGEYLSTLEQKINIHKQKKAAFSDLFRTILQQLMTAEIRVHDIDLPGFDKSATITPQGTIQGST